MFPTAAWMATELFATFGNALALTLTPAGSGRFEVYLNDRKIWDRKEALGHPSPSLAVVHDLRDIVREELALVGAAE
jgi:selT/selW/selH-like putative selenoprotein